MANLAKFRNEAMKMKAQTPWSLLDKTIPFDPQKHANLLRDNQAIPVLMLRPAIITAVEHYVNSSETNNTLFPFRLVRRKEGGVTTYCLELHYEPSRCLLMSYQEDGNLLVSDVDIGNKMSSALAAWNANKALLYGLPLLLIPHILKKEQEAGEDGLKAVLGALAKEIPDCYLHQSKNDFDPDTIDHLFYLSIIMEYLGKIKVDLNASGLPNEWMGIFTTAKFGGEVIAENFPAAIQFLDTTGKANRYSAQNQVTMAEAIAQFSAYSANRNWSEDEKLLIPKFPADMPVMKEVLQLAKRITDTHNDTNPVVNVMWRGVTSYGKSTGVKQLAAILNMPLLIMTCHPGMEAQDFKSQFVPKTSASGVKLINRQLHQNVSASKTDSQIPYLKEALDHIRSLSDQEQNDLLDIHNFFEEAVMDCCGAFEWLTGLHQDRIDSASVYTLYAAVRMAMQQEQADVKIAALESQLNDAKQHEGNKPESSRPEFEHIVSDYVRALVNGYLVEVQEASRIRDSGVLVGLNEFDAPGSLIRMVDGTYAQRHPDAIQIITDNVGYSSCRPIDPSVIRRQGMIIDSYELTEDELISRVKWNTGCKDKALMKKAYKVWNKVKEYCQDNAIEDGAVSATELERLVQAVMYDGEDSFAENLNCCVISKATSSIDDQIAIRSAIEALVS